MMLSFLQSIDDKAQAALLTALASAFAALISAVVAFITLWANRSTARQIEVLKDQLGSRARDRDAVRDYEYAARRRLYSECEPVIFRFLESCDAARIRIERMAGHNPALQPLDFAADADHRLSTLYRLVAPVAEFALLRERLTMFDLHLEPRIYAEYSLGRLAVEAFHEDAHFASAEPARPYQPGQRPGWGKKADTAIYSRQGISPEDTEQLVDALVEVSADGKRMISYQQFRHQARSRGAVKDMVIRLAYLVQDFSPQRRPVLWRVLSAQHGLYTLLRRTAQGKGGKLSFAVPEDTPLATGDSYLDRETEQATRSYLETRLARIQILENPVVDTTDKP